MNKENKKKKILLVDDNEIHLSTVKIMLEDYYEVATARSGKEALVQILRGQFPNLILLDILMPEMDGWEVYNRIKAISFLQDIPIAFFTSVDETAEKARALEIGVVDYIPKPCKKNELLERIDKILNNTSIKAEGELR